MLCKVPDILLILKIEITFLTLHVKELNFSKLQ